jgi:hypothetical protein
MASTYLTPDMVTRTALAVLHQEANFIGNINRQYDDSFVQNGAKIGDALRIRLPNQYAVITGATYTDVDQTEISTTLTINTWKQVPMYFNDSDLTLKIDAFAERYVKPAVSVLAASLESAALTMTDDVYQVIDNTSSSLGLNEVLRARKAMVDSLTPLDGRWTALLRTQDNVNFVNNAKGLFQSASEIASQYKKGIVGMAGGFSFYENTLMPAHLTGSTSAVSNYTVASTVTVSASTGTATLTLLNTLGVGTLKAGDVITITGLNSCHPESKADTGVVQQFVVTADMSATTSPSVSIAPTIYMTGGRQNVVSTVISGKAVVKVGESSSTYYQSLFFHPDAFTFATADLNLPKGVDMASRQVKDGVSIRLVRDFDPVYSRMITRLDVLGGYKTIRPQLAARIFSKVNG